MSARPEAITRWLRLAPVFDAGRLRADLDTALALHWRAHYNDQAHAGSWTSIALRSGSGRADDIDAGDNPVFADTPLLARCPYLRQVIDSFACDKQAVRLMALDAGARILPHRDPGGAFEDGLARLHVPIATHPAVLFTLDNSAPCTEPARVQPAPMIPRRASSSRSLATSSFIVDEALSTTTSGASGAS